MRNVTDRRAFFTGLFGLGAATVLTKACVDSGPVLVPTPQAGDRAADGYVFLGHVYANHPGSERIDKCFCDGVEVERVCEGDDTEGWLLHYKTLEPGSTEPDLHRIRGHVRFTLMPTPERIAFVPASTRVRYPEQEYAQRALDGLMDALGEAG